MMKGPTVFAALACSTIAVLFVVVGTFSLVHANEVPVHGNEGDDYNLEVGGEQKNNMMQHQGEQGYTDAMHDTGRKLTEGADHKEEEPHEVAERGDGEGRTLEGEYYGDKGYGRGKGYYDDGGRYDYDGGYGKGKEYYDDGGRYDYDGGYDKGKGYYDDDGGYYGKGGYGYSPYYKKYYNKYAKDQDKYKYRKEAAMLYKKKRDDRFARKKNMFNKNSKFDRDHVDHAAKKNFHIKIDAKYNKANYFSADKVNAKKNLYDKNYADKADYFKKEDEKKFKANQRYYDKYNKLNKTYKKKYYKKDYYKKN